MPTKLTDYLQTAQAAEVLGVSQNTLRKWAATGKIPVQKNPANGYRLFRRSDLDRFLRTIATPLKPSQSISRRKAK
jgi:excisionase family DNA binding protein